MGRLGLAMRPELAPKVKACSWSLPDGNIVKANVEGASRGNLGLAGYGKVSRDKTCIFLEVVNEGICNGDNFSAEYLVILDASMNAVSRGWQQLWIESDSQTAVLAFNNRNLPWRIKMRWKLIKAKLIKVMVSHNWREANFIADCASKRGSFLDASVTESFLSRPQ